MFGSEGLIVISVISAYMIVFTNIVSVAIFAFYSTDEPSEEKSGKFGTHVKSLAANPLIIASLGGMLFNYAHIEIGAAAKNTLTTLSGAALSIGMLNVGAGLRFDISGQDFKLVVYSGLIKLFVFPIVTWIFLFLFSVTGIERSVGLLYACLPCASTSYALSRQLGGHPDSMASIITFTTVFSVISLSFLMYIL